MKKIALLFLSLACVFAGTAANAQEVAEKAQESMAASGSSPWEKYMEVGPMHKMLEASNGDWKAEITFWMEPGAAPQKSTSSCTNSMILGGRYQESKHSGTVMGMPFEGQGLVGYDNIKKVFISTWVDNMGSGVMVAEGPYDEKTKSITMRGNTMDPMTGKEIKTRQVFTFIDDKTEKFEMFMNQDGKEIKSMEILYTR
jgi:hypothetical protein